MMGLFTPGYKSKNPEKREKAVRKLNPLNQKHQKIIIEIVQTELNYYVRKAAIERLTDLNLVVQLAQIEKDAEIRKIAVGKLVSVFKLPGQNISFDAEIQKILHKIARSDQDIEIAILAIAKITDQSVLFDISKHATFSVARKTAVQKLTDQDILKNFALKDKSSEVSICAVNYMFDKNLLAEIANSANNLEVRDIAYRKLGLQNSEKAIANRAKFADYSAGLENLNDQKLLTDVAHNAKSEYVQKTASLKVTEQTLMAEIALKSKSLYIVEPLLEKITEQNLLNEIAENATEIMVQYKAALKLNDTSAKVNKLIRIFHDVMYYKLEVAEQLKNIYKNESLSTADKANILQLNGKLVKEHHDTTSYTHFCGGSNEIHTDEPAIYFEI